MQDLPFAPSCENNKDPILNVLRQHFLPVGSSEQDAEESGAARKQVLEIASGTGQHAVYFAQNMPFLSWQCTELPEHLAGLDRRLTFADLPNLHSALAFDVMQDNWPFLPVDYIFTANSLHIMPIEAVVQLFRHVGTLLKRDGLLAVYGPFKYNGDFTTPSNAQFDQRLKERDPRSGVRDFERVNALAEEAGLTLLQDNAMPANNQLLVWQMSS